jgi:hypothetical protein
MKRTDNQLNGERLFNHYKKLNTDYASIVKMLPYAAESFEKAFEILERCQKENKRLFAYYPGIDTASPKVMTQIELMEPIGEIIDGYLYLVPNEWIYRNKLKP